MQSKHTILRTGISNVMALEMRKKLNYFCLQVANAASEMSFKGINLVPRYAPSDVTKSTQLASKIRSANASAENPANCGNDVSAHYLSVLCEY